MNDIIDFFFESIILPACIVDKKLNILRVNTYFSDFIETPELNSYQGVPLKKYLNFNIFSQDPNLIENILANMKNVLFDNVELHREEGGNEFLNINITPTTFFSKESESLILIFSDLTQNKDLKIKYQKLLRRKEKLLRLNTNLYKKVKTILSEKSKELYETHIKLEKAYLELNLVINVSISIIVLCLSDL